MEELILINDAQIGDYIRCSCELGCRTQTNCNVFCNSNSCKTSPVYEQVVEIISQSSINSVWFQLLLTNNKTVYGWINSLITKLV